MANGCRMKNMKTSRDFIEEAAAMLTQLRKEAPLVHCITNDVVASYTANCLLAVGAAPAMIPDPNEARQFAAVASALLINVGTITEAQADAMRAAVDSANSAGRPWVLDPVAVGALTLRTSLANELKLKMPALIRGNASEIIALAGFKASGRGVDSTAAVDEAREAASMLAEETGAAVLVTGPVDIAVSRGKPVVSISNGTPLMTRVTGVGCAQGAICAALATLSEDKHAVAVATALVMAVAGDMAAEKTSRPGSFQIALLDALDAVGAEELVSRGKVAL